jgi:hypothetical protein
VVAAEMVGVIVGEWGKRWRKEEGGDLRSFACSFVLLGICIEEAG